MVQPIQAPIANMAREATRTGIATSQYRRLETVSVVHVDLRYATMTPGKISATRYATAMMAQTRKINAPTA